MSRSVADGAKSMGALAAGLDDAARAGLVAAARVAGADMARAVRAGAPRGRLNAGPVGVRVTVERDHAAIVPTGPVGLLENPVAPHVIGPRRSTAMGGALDHPVGAPVRHPGQRARHVWSRAEPAAVRDAGEAFHTRTSPALRRAYKRG